MIHHNPSMRMKPRGFSFLLLVITAGMFTLVSSIAATLAAVWPVGLRVEHAVDPIGIDAAKPRLSWRMESDRPGAMQTAYQIEVAGVWDSGKVESDRSIAIPYGGPALSSVTSYPWRVRVWDEKGEVSPWSEGARWTTGLMTPDDWKGIWLAPPKSMTSPSAKSTGDIRIRKAIYRTPDGKVSVDLTGKVSELVNGGRNPLPVDFQLLGIDPAPGVVKELVVEYTHGGNEGTSVARDFENLHIPRQPTGDVAWWFRRDFTLAAAPGSALVTVHTPAYFELYVNGEKVGGDVLTPAFTDLPDTTFTVTYDVAKLLRPGNNTLGIWLGMGWSTPKNFGWDTAMGFLAQLNAVVDGKTLVIGSDDQWKALPSNYSRIGGREWNHFGGERIDATFDFPDWAKPGIDTSNWLTPLFLTKPAASGKPVNHNAPLNRIGKRIPAQKVIPLGEGRFEIDFGTNLTGWLELKFPQLKAGQVVKMVFADRVFPDGKQATPLGEVQVQMASCVSFPRSGGGTNVYQNYNQASEFISAGKPGEVFRNKFNYAGFRHVVVEGLPVAPKLEDATALLVESDMNPIGSFECSDERINRIHKVNVWTLRSLNLGSYAVDCPHRERMGYGDGQVFFEGMMTGFDAARFYEKSFGDWRDAQNPDGSSTYVAPAVTGGGGGPPWPGIIAEGPWQHYLHYGDPAILEQNLAHALRYIEYLDSRATHDVLRDWGGGLNFLGDWVAPGRGMDTGNFPSKEMAELFNNCYRVLLWQWIGNMARTLGRDELAGRASNRMDAIRKATHAAFYDATNKRYAADEQIYYLMPVITGVTPEIEREAVIQNFLKCLTEKNKGRPDTGMIGTKYLVNFLDQTGRDALILPFYQSPDFPGWGYMVENGATTLWEQWNGFWSQIHSCFASADNWLYRGLAGIKPDPAGPGFKKIIIEPAIVGDITWVKAHHDSPYGPISVNWTREGGKLVLDVETPPNSSAAVIVPLGGGTHQVGPGRHRFESGNR
jgi:alpha-L-rhamnosidase